MTAEFSLRDLIAETVDQSTDADPATIADQVAEAIGSRNLRQALRQALGPIVTQVVTNRRNQALNDVPEPANQVGSKRWRAASSILQERFEVPGQGWKFLGDCTAADLIAGATHRRNLAAGIIRQATKYESLATMLDDRGLTRVADLGEDPVREVLAA